MAGSCLKNVVFVHKMDLDELNLIKIDICMVFDPRNKYNEVIFKKIPKLTSICRGQRSNLTKFAPKKAHLSPVYGFGWSDLDEIWHRHAT